MSETLTATKILSQNKLSTDDFSLAVTEYIIDDCINIVNLLGWQSMDAMSGDEGDKSVSVTRLQAPVVKMLISLVLRENKKTGFSSANSTGGSESTNQSASMGPVSVSESNSTSTAISAAETINNPANSVFVEFFKISCEELKRQAEPTTAPISPPIYISKDTTGLNE